jgi:polysaccharide biosynthesis transport protein
MKEPRGIAGYRQRTLPKRQYEVLPRSYNGVIAETAVPDSPLALTYWRIIIRHKCAFLLCCIAGLASGVLFSSFQRPMYRARAAVEIQAPSNDLLNLRNVDPSTSANEYGSAESEINTQTILMHSRGVLENAINKLSLKGRAAAAEKKYGTFLGRFVSSKKGGVEGEPAMRLAEAGLNIRTLPNTRLIEVAFDSPDPQLSSDFANAIAISYIEVTQEKRWQHIQHTSEWLNGQMRDLKAKLAKSEDELRQLTRGSDLMFSSENGNEVETDRLRRLQEELSRAQAERAAKQSSFELLTSVAPETLPQVLDDPTLREYQLNLTKLNRELAELSSLFTPSYPKMIKLQAEIALIQKDLGARRAEVLRRIRNEYSSACRREQLLSADFATEMHRITEQGERIARYKLLRREVDATRQLYETMFQRVREAGLASAMRVTNIQIVDAALPPPRPFRPNLPLNAGFGLSIGLVGGGGLIILRHREHHKIEGPGEATLWADAAELGVIPSGAPGIMWRLLPRVRLAPSEPVELMAWSRKLSAMAESFRMILTSILFGRDGPPPRLIVISSANANEGKTTVACNLAIVLSQLSRRVLLVDGDTHRPRLHEIFALENEVGLTEALAGTAELAVQETRVPNLYVLTSGKLSNSPELLFGPKLPQFLNRIRTEFDAVVIDAPPLLELADARLLGRHSEGVILVTRAQHTSPQALRNARQRLFEDGTPLLGAILNDWNQGPSSGYYSKSYKPA